MSNVRCQLSFAGHQMVDVECFEGNPLRVAKILQKYAFSI